jgi:putative SOS response-associated peptidase YedK
MFQGISLTAPAAVVATMFDLPAVPDIPPREYVAPSHPVAAVRVAITGGRELVFLRWGLIPSWATDPTIGANLTYARADSVAETPAFRSAFRRRRCLIPVSGFVVGAKTGDRQQAYLVRRTDGTPFALAGLWEWFQSPEGAEIESCTILTTAANALVWHLGDRMPAIINSEHFARWLDPAYQRVEELKPLLVPYPADALEAIAFDLITSDGPE